MSRIVATLVYSKVIGSAHRKAVLAYCADRASDDGSGVWCSKQTIAAETEVARSTVIKIINEFVAEGLLIQTGTRRCANGATIEYRVNVEQLRTLPSVRTPQIAPVRQPDPSASRTSINPDPSGSRTPPVREPDPMPSGSRTQTVLEPSLNHVCVEGGSGLFLETLAAAGHQTGRIPSAWMPPAAEIHVNRWRALGLTDAEIIDTVRQVTARSPEPSRSPRFFDHHMQRLAGAKTAPALQAATPAAGDRTSDRKRVDQAINRLADDLSSGAVRLDYSNRDPFAAR